MLYRHVLRIKSEPDKFYDITQQINEIIKKCMIKDGLCHLYLKSTTASLLLQEYDVMLLTDLRKLMEELTPKQKLYQHPKNAFSHIRASLLKTELTIPLFNGSLDSGQKQSIILMEFDTVAGEREIILTISGE
ncbi:MAG: YjbQ family protein [Candidatus Aenigmarchaeota archaeon]|nr:YjbQ family protein [Candidatus Aenigmarchaeota archaeon]